MKRKNPRQVRSRKPAQNLTAIFVEAVEATIGPLLTAYGFAKEKTRRDKTSASCLYGKGTAYVELTLGLHPLDYPQSGDVRLGDGLRKWPDQDWNGVALCCLGKAYPTVAPVSNYRIAAFSTLPALVARMRKDLERVGHEFLRGDLEVFKRVRGEVNRGREPYKMHRPNGDGTYNTEADAESIALKARFS